MLNDLMRLERFIDILLHICAVVKEKINQIDGIASCGKKAGMLQKLEKHLTWQESLGNIPP